MMNFSEQLKREREAKKLTVKELSKISGVTSLSIQKYEEGTKYPNFSHVEKLASALDIACDNLLDKIDKLIIEAHEKGGAKDARAVDSLLSPVIQMSVEHNLYDDAKNGILEALYDTYWIAKRMSHETFTPKRYRTERISDHG